MAFLNRSRSIIFSRQAPLPFIWNAVRHMAGSRLLVTGLSQRTYYLGLEEAFSRFGDVADAVIIPSDLDIVRFSNYEVGIGIVRFNNDESASSALSSMDGQVLDGEIIRVQYANGSRVSEFENYYPDEKKTPFLKRRPLIEYDSYECESSDDKLDDLLN